MKRIAVVAASIMLVSAGFAGPVSAETGPALPASTSIDTVSSVSSTGLVAELYLGSRAKDKERR